MRTQVRTGKKHLICIQIEELAKPEAADKAHILINTPFIEEVLSPQQVDFDEEESAQLLKQDFEIKLIDGLVGERRKNSYRELNLDMQQLPKSDSEVSKESQDSKNQLIQFEKSQEPLNNLPEALAFED